MCSIIRDNVTYEIDFKTTADRLICEQTLIHNVKLRMLNILLLPTHETNFYQCELLLVLDHI